MSILPHLILGGAFLSYTALETFTFEVDEKHLYSPDIPPNFDEVRIVFLSDVHHGIMLRHGSLRKIIRKIEFLQPHLILFGGDYIQSKLTYKQQHKYLNNFFNEVKVLKAPLGKFGVLGNHDHDEVGAEATRLAMRAAGVRPIDNEGLWIWKGFQKIRLGGVGDLTYDTQDLAATLDPVKPNDYVIMLSHQPQYVDLINRAKVDLMLTGHTHGGQVIPTSQVPINLGKLVKKNRVKGWMQIGPTTLLISRGLGSEFPYVRFLNQPQLHLITLHHDPEPREIPNKPLSRKERENKELQDQLQAVLKKYHKKRRFYPPNPFKAFIKPKPVRKPTPEPKPEPVEPPPSISSLT